MGKRTDIELYRQRFGPKIGTKYYPAIKKELTMSKELYDQDSSYNYTVQYDPLPNWSKKLHALVPNWLLGAIIITIPIVVAVLLAINLLVGALN